MKVLLTGAGGFLGRHVLNTLRNAGYFLRLAEMPGVDLSSMAGKDAEIVYCDLTLPREVWKICRGMDAIVNAAAIFKFSVPRETIRRANVEAVANLCCSAMDAGVKRFVQVSTVGVYGRPARLPCLEDMPKSPRSLYESTKWEGERVAWEYYGKYGLPVVALRPTLAYGPYSRYGTALFIVGFSMLAARGVKKIDVFGPGQMGHHVHAEDVARAVEFLLGSRDGVGKAFNVADDAPLSFSEFVKAIMNAVGLRVRREINLPGWLFRSIVKIILKSPDFLTRRFNRRLDRNWAHLVRKNGLVNILKPVFEKEWLDYLATDHIFDTTRLKGLGFRFKFPDIREGLVHTVEWYRKNRWLA